MATKQENNPNSTNLPTDLKAEQALGIIGMGLMQKITSESEKPWGWSEPEEGRKADLHALRQRLELTS